MKKWEYKTWEIDISISARDSTLLLNGFGLDGWKLVQLMPPPSGCKVGLAYFVRPTKYDPRKVEGE